MILTFVFTKIYCGLYIKIKSSCFGIIVHAYIIIIIIISSNINIQIKYCISVHFLFISVFWVILQMFPYCKRIDFTIFRLGAFKVLFGLKNRHFKSIYEYTQKYKTGAKTRIRKKFTHCKVGDQKKNIN